MQFLLSHFTHARSVIFIWSVTLYLTDVQFTSWMCRKLLWWILPAAETRLASLPERFGPTTSGKSEALHDSVIVSLLQVSRALNGKLAGSVGDPGVSTAGKVNFLEQTTSRTPFLFTCRHQMFIMCHHFTRENIARSHGSCKRTFFQTWSQGGKFENGALALSCGRRIHILCLSMTP